MKNKLLLILILAFASVSEAQTLMENFAYGTTTGTIADSLTNTAFGGNTALGNQRWRRHSGTGNPVKYLGSSLSYPGYTSSGVAGSAGFTFMSASAEDAHRNTQTITSGNVYVSFLLRMTASGGTTGDYFFHIMDTTFITAFRARLYLRDGSAANTYKIGLNKGSSATPFYSTPDYKLDSTILVVIKYAFNPTFTDTVSAYIFTGGIPATEPSVPTLIAPDNGTVGDLAKFNSIAIRQGTIGTMSGTIDGIRIATTWADGPLPVTLLDFRANLNEANGTQLKWSTSSETNNKGFEIERSADGENFENVAFVKGAGNSKTIEQYAFQLDYFTPAYYRLKQIDFDGAFEYSQVVYSGGEVSEIELSPNPFVETLKLNSNSNIDKIEIIDLTGKVLVSETINKETAEVETSHLAKGIYFINISQGGSVQTKRIIKTN
jgi:hypothetical protein